MAEMLTQLQGMKLLTRFVARDQRRALLELEDQIRGLAAAVDRFYELLGPRNWVFHDDLDVTLVERLIALLPDQAERVLIDSYRDPEQMRFKVRRLGRFPELRIRMPLIEKAEADFHAGRHYATVLALLSVMDGFVNDVERDQRKGLHAREAGEMVAWDSVVGHHMGLAHAHKTFVKTIRKTSDEGVYELYRHGIVHGMLTNYDNDVVSAKAWNRLFAVADWATSREKAQAPRKERPSWRELSRSIAENARTKEALDQWRPSSTAAGEPDFDADEVVAVSREYLTSWQAKNYGRMADLLSPLIGGATIRETAGQVREEHEGSSLRSFDLERVEHTAPAVARVDVALDVDVSVVQGTMRWIRSASDGMGVAPNETGSWRLMTWTVASMTAERRDKTGG